jgi:urease accessory protein
MGFVVATGLLHATGITIGLAHRWGWGRQVLRGAGMIILCGGLYFVWAAVA